MDVPNEIGGTRVILYSTDPNVAICQYGEEESFYLFGFDENWDSVTDTWHATVEDAKRQAEGEHKGLTSSWQSAK